MPKIRSTESISRKHSPWRDMLPWHQSVLAVLGRCAQKSLSPRPTTTIRSCARDSVCLVVVLTARIHDSGRASQSLTPADWENRCASALQAACMQAQRSAHHCIVRSGCKRTRTGMRERAWCGPSDKKGGDDVQCVVQKVSDRRREPGLIAACKSCCWEA